MSDRIVEPYLFLSDNTEVRCYEVASGMNKTFKISRAQSIELLDMLWSHKDKHKPIYTDLFHFSSETTTTVRLLLGTLATSLLLEEYPAAEHEMKQQEDGRYLLTTNVCSFKGIGRFVLGLFDDIEIIDSPELTKYLQTQAELLTQKNQK
jgi:predicted DNA-binding transcriptional regulator YafY